MPDTATPLETAYTACMVLNLLTTLWNLGYAQRQLSELKQYGTDRQVEVLRRGARNDQLRLTGIGAPLVVIGINAMLAPANDAAPTIFAWINGCSFILLSVLLAWLSAACAVRPGLILREGRITSK